MNPLLYRGARTRQAELHRQFGLHPAGDPLLATSFDAVLHVERFDELPAELLNRLHTIEHFDDPRTLRIVRRRVPLWVRKDGGYEVPNRLVPLIQQYFCSSARRSEGPAVEVNTDAYPAIADPLVPAALDAYGRAVVKYAVGVTLSPTFAVSPVLDGGGGLKHR